MKQRELILKYLQEHGSILPAKLGGQTYLGHLWPSEISKRCRELRAKGILASAPDGKFERYYLAIESPRSKALAAETLKRFMDIPIFKAERSEVKQGLGLFP